MNQPLRLRSNRRLAPTAAVLGLLALALAVPGARAQTTTTVNFKGKTASAIFQSFDETGCIEIDVGVNATLRACHALLLI